LEGRPFVERRHVTVDGAAALQPGLRGGPEEALLWVDRLEKTFGLDGRRGYHRPEPIRALDGVSFDVRTGETFGVVGESGSGKSTLARCILRLVRPNGGRVLLGGADLLTLSSAEMRRARRRMQIVFQDSSASLDPRMPARGIVEEALVVHGIGSRDERRRRASEMLELVGITPAQILRKPHEFSSGQRQRIGVARALVLQPEVVILDEPISALDVSIQAQVLNLLRRLQEQLHLTYLFIVHDLVVAEHFCDRVAVLYLGTVVELADRETLFRAPLHPYTVSLLSAVPIPERFGDRRRERIVLRGELTPASADRRGCRFEPRCPLGRGRSLCREQEPPLVERVRGQWVACHFPGELPSYRRGFV
jgi:oligopeptide/dipeptide ABC transporter ATP-binding protein